jgi:hypothetical protein
MVEMRNAYKILVRKPEEKELLRKHSHRWVDNIKMDMKEIVFENVDRIRLHRRGSTDGIL